MIQECEPTLSLATHEQICAELAKRYRAFVLAVEKETMVKANDTSDMVYSYGGGWSSCWSLSRYVTMRFEQQAAIRVAQAQSGLIP